MRVWLDDKRPMPKGFSKHVKTAWEAIEILQTKRVTFISLDHDLGDRLKVGEGNDVAKWIEDNAHSGSLLRLGWAIHSQNPVGEKNMIAALRNADKFWDELDITDEDDQ